MTAHPAAYIAVVIMIMMIIMKVILMYGVCNKCVKEKKKIQAFRKIIRIVDDPI
jgi:hypothetical protein